MRTLTAVVCGLLLLGSVGGRGARAQAPAKGGAAMEGALTNADVVKLCHSGLSEQVIIAKINQAPQVAFALGADDLVRLKDQKVSDAIVAAMLGRSSAPAMPGPLAGAPRSRAEVRLATRDGEFDMKPLAGTLSSTYVYVKIMHYMDYPGLAAKLRIRDRRPSVLIATDNDPRNRYFVVKAESNEKDANRSVKIGSGGLFRAKGLNVPDEDWTLEYQANEERPGIWRLVLKDDLAPGEYGIFHDGNLFEFGLDK